MSLFETLSSDISNEGKRLVLQTRITFFEEGLTFYRERVFDYESQIEQLKKQLDDLTKNPSNPSNTIVDDDDLFPVGIV